MFSRGYQTQTEFKKAAQKLSKLFRISVKLQKVYRTLQKIYDLFGVLKKFRKIKYLPRSSEILPISSILAFQQTFKNSVCYMDSTKNPEVQSTSENLRRFFQRKKTVPEI